MFRRLLPETLAGRFIATMGLTLLGTWLAVIGIVEYEANINEAKIATRVESRTAGALAEVLLETRDPEERQHLLTTMQRSFPAFQAEWWDRPGFARAEPELGYLLGDFPTGYRAGTVLDQPPATDGTTGIIITSPQGVSLKLDIAFGRLRFVSWSSVALTIAGTASLLLFIAWISKSLTRQLHRLSDAALRFSPEHPDEPLPVAGPIEVRQLASTFNDMQKRISRLMASQSLALRAVGHDLKTPVTRMRMRTGKVTDPAVRDALERDLSYMEDMANDVLSVLDSSTYRGLGEATNLASIVATACQDFVELGTDVTYIGPTRFVMSARSDDILRILSNLLSNASRYAKRVEVALLERDTEAGCCIIIDDDGPGIATLPDSGSPPMLPGRPHESGHGLGLYIARTLAGGHGGGLELSKSPLGGLRVTVRLNPT